MPGKTRMRTNEGPAAVKEAINYLKKQTPLGAMSWSNALEKACKDHTLDQGPIGGFGHVGSKGQTMTQRIEKYGKPQGGWGENIAYGYDTALEIIT